MNANNSTFPIKSKDIRLAFMINPLMFISLYVSTSLLSPCCLIAEEFFPNNDKEISTNEHTIPQVPNEKIDSINIDVSAIASSTRSLPEAATEAKVFLQDVVRNGSPQMAIHVLSAMKWTKDKSLVPAARERLERSEPGREGKQVALGAMAALIELDEADFSVELEQLLNDEDERVRSRALMLARDSRDGSLLFAVERAAAKETDGAIKALAVSSIHALTAVSGKPASRVATKIEMEIKGHKGAEQRAEIDRFTQDQQQLSVQLSTEDEEKLRQMVLSSRHGERIYAIEKLSLHGSEAIRGWLDGLGDEENWQLRMTSAYGLLIGGDSERARLRLKSETDPLVTVILLSAVSREKP